MKYDNFTTRRNAFGYAKIAQTAAHKLLYPQITENLSPNSKILEIGPGEGFFAQYCTDNNYDYTFIEENKKTAIDLATRGYKALYISHAPPITTSRKFDLIYIGMVLEHTKDHQEAYKLLQDAYSVLAPGGKCVVLVPDITSWKQDFYDCDYTHSYPTSPSRLLQMVDDIGVSKSSCKSLYGLLPTIVGLPLQCLIKLFMTPLRTLWPNSRYLRKIITLCNRNILLVLEKPLEHL